MKKRKCERYKILELLRNLTCCRGKECQKIFFKMRGGFFFFEWKEKTKKAVKMDYEEIVPKIISGAFSSTFLFIIEIFKFDVE